MLAQPRATLCAARRGSGRFARGSGRRGGARAQGLASFHEEDLIVHRQVGAMQLVRVQTTGSVRDSQDEDFDPEVRMYAKQEYDDVGLTARLYAGEVVSGPYAGRDVILKEYPFTDPDDEMGFDFDELAASELVAHSILQAEEESRDHISWLLGGYEGTLGEKWLVFENTGIVQTSASWALKASQSLEPSSQSKTLLSLLSPDLHIRRSQAFALSVIKQAITSLAFMHSRHMLHQSIGPDSVALSTVDEVELQGLRVRLRDLAFAVDAREGTLKGGGTLAELWEAGQQIERSQDETVFVGEGMAAELWRRASNCGCTTAYQMRNFGVADDIYQMGLFLLFICFFPFCERGSVDIMTLTRCAEVTFAGDIKKGFRDYMGADERFASAVQWLDDSDGWSLLDAMLQPEWKSRPTADSCLKHPFLTQVVAYN